MKPLPLDNILAHLKKRKYKNELHFLNTVYKFCFRYKITYAEYSTVGWKSMGNTLLTFDKDGFFNKKEYRIKKVTQEQADEKLTADLKKIVAKESVIIVYRSFFGMKSIIFFDHKSNTSIKIDGQAMEHQKGFINLVNQYHSL